MTQIESVRRNIITGLIRKIAEDERLPIGHICKCLNEGTIVIPANRLRRLKKPCGIGKGLRTKVNANIGTSPLIANLAEELKKLEICIKYKADTVMDLSTGSNIAKIRKAIIRNSPIPVGTVPLYEVAVMAQHNKVEFHEVSVDDIFEAIENQAKDGVDFFTIHAGVTQKVLKFLKTARRVVGIVSKGGALIALWMKKNKKENPLFENFDRVLSIAKEYDITLSLGDGLRPGSVCDATDRPQIEELKILGELAKMANAKGVQAMIEGPGHIPLNQIETNVRLEKRLCNNAPFYVLGPLVTDVTGGYDHITSAIGATLAAYYGADFLCYVTPSEHLGIPRVDDVKDGLIASRIAAHSADLAKGLKGAIDWDRSVSTFRKARMWDKHLKGLIDPQRARQIHNRCKAKFRNGCSMCGEYCPLRISEE